MSLKKLLKGKKTVSLSIYINGLEKGFNDNARSRAIVIHSAPYVTEGGKVGRSWGCPVVAPNRIEEVINTIKNGTCFFIYYPDTDYLSKSLLAREDPAFSQEDFIGMDEEWEDEEFGLESFLFENEEETNVTEDAEIDDNPLPETIGNVPFAPTPPPGSYWPIITSVANGKVVSYKTESGDIKGSSSRKFLANRTTSSGAPRHHVAIDLYAKFNDPVIACDNGRILSFKHFYTTKSGNPTNCLIVQHSNVIVNYGEVGPSSFQRLGLKVGDAVKAGQIIGFVGATQMLHFETYRLIDNLDSLPPHRWMKNQQNPPATLYNPTKYLLYLKQYGLVAKVNQNPISTHPNSPAVTAGLDIAKAIRLNKSYKEKLRWGEYIEQISEYLLPYTDQTDINSNETKFALAVAEWQRSQGFPEKNIDGIIGPNTWAELEAALGLKNPVKQQPINSVSVDIKVIANINLHAADIEKYSKAGNINPNLVRAIIAAESGGNSNSGKGKNGYKGLMQAETTADQLTPAVSLQSGIKKFNLFKDTILKKWLTDLNIQPASIDRYEHLKMCLSCYNAGPVTALKAIKYAHIAGDYRQWLSEEHYKRALLFSGGYAQYSTCNKNKSENDILKAKAERLKYRFKTAGWRTEPDPATWKSIYSSLNPIMRCWLEKKYEYTPGYLNKFIEYFKYFEESKIANEFEEEDSYVPETEYLDSLDEAIELSENEGHITEFESEGINISEDEFNSLTDESSNDAEQFIFELEDFVANISKAVTANRKFSSQLGWNSHYQEINDILLPFSGMVGVSLGEEDFVHALALWQRQQGFADKDADGMLGPKTWAIMKQYFSQPTSVTPPPRNLPADAQQEWRNNPGIASKYGTSQLYEQKRKEVIAWGIPNPAEYIEQSIQEWNNNTGIHHHFGNNFDGDPKRSYLNLRRLYQAKGISNPGEYFSNHIVPISFFNKHSPGHRDLKQALERAQANLKTTGQTYPLNSAWSFVPRTFNDNINKLSNHALGKAIDINPSTNPHIASSEEILVINTLCQSIIPQGILNQNNPDILRQASNYFNNNFISWASNQTDPFLQKAISRKRKTLNKYAANGFMDLPTDFIQALQNAGLSWGGNWRTSKDFMHFELP